MQNELSSVVTLDLLLCPSKLCCLALEVLNVLETRKHRVQVEDADAAPGDVIAVVTVVEEGLLDRRELRV